MNNSNGISLEKGGGKRERDASRICGFDGVFSEARERGEIYALRVALGFCNITM